MEILEEENKWHTLAVMQKFIPVPVPTRKWVCLVCYDTELGLRYQYPTIPKLNPKEFKQEWRMNE